MLDILFVQIIELQYREFEGNLTSSPTVDFIVKVISSKQGKSTREIILHAIKASNHSTVGTLAKAADISPVTVRHHLNSLQADNLITSESVRRKVGRPYYVYSLSQEGAELFPKRYVQLSSRLLDELKTHLPSEQVKTIVSNIAAGILNDYKGEYENLPFEQQLDFLVKLLNSEGFLSSWEKTEEGYSLIEYSCPYLSVSKEHNELCSFDTELILGVLQTTVEHRSCMIQGAEHCEFTMSRQTN